MPVETADRKASGNLHVAFYGNLASVVEPRLFDLFRAREVGHAPAPDHDSADLHVICAWPDGSLGQDGLRAIGQLVPSGNGATIAVIEAPDPLDGSSSTVDLDAWNAELKSMSDALGAHFVPIRSKFLRWGPRECLEGDFRPSQRGAKAIANAVARLVVREQASASISDADVTLTDAKTGKNLRDLLEADPAAADDLLAGMCSPAAAVWPDYFWSASEPDLDAAWSAEVDPASVDVLRPLLDGLIAMPARYGWPRLQLGEGHGIDWSQAGPDRSWQSMFLGLDFLVAPLSVIWRLLASEHTRADETARAEAAFAKALDVFLSFQKQNPPHAPVTPRAWHEGTASRRLRALFALLSCCLLARRKSREIPAGTVARVGLELARTAHLLTPDATYIEAGNHGVRQDYGLYVTSRILGGSREAAEWRSLALQRLDERQFRKGMSTDGVWLEHSSGYHLLVLRYVAAAERAARVAHDQAASDFFGRQIQRMLPFVECIVLPDDAIAMIGDTESGKHSSPIRHARSYAAGSETGGTAAFPDAGYLIRRPQGIEKEDGLHFFFYANLKSSKHKHADDLAIILQHGRTPWLIDSGSINRETSDGLRNAVRFDPAAHNTWRVNGGGYSFNRRTADEVGFVATHQHENWCGACAVNKLYPGGEVMRFVVCVPGERLVVAIDRLASKDDNAAHFEQFWHLAPGTRITDNENGFLATRDDQPTRLHVAVDRDADDKWEQWEGGPDQPIGWTMTSWNEVTPNPVLRRSLSSTERWCVTAFQLRADGGRPILVRELAASPDGATLTLQLPDSIARITVGVSGEISLETPL